MSRVDVALSRKRIRGSENSISCAITIAGSDSCGGAGIEADLKTFAALGVYGTCAITAVTAQNTQGVRQIFPVPAEIVRRQIDVVMEDIPIQAAKTGMLYSEGVMEVVAESIVTYGLKVVVDPVLRAATGDPLILESDIEALIRLIVPRAYVLTPNVPEAEAISNVRIRSIEEMKEAAQKIAELGAGSVVVKGGHLKPMENEVHDILYHDGIFKVFGKPRIGVEPHGGGCTFSAAITAHLAAGADLTEAVERAEEFMGTSVEYSTPVGGGRAPVNPMADLYNKSEMFQVLDDVERAAEMIESHSEFLPFIAEVGTQVAMALPCPLNEKDVAAIEGRIVKFRNKAKAVGSPHYGASQHIASIILAAMKYDHKIRGAINLHYESRLVEAFRKTGFAVSSFDRKLEPTDKKHAEGKSLSWGTGEAIRSFGKVPDVIFDEGEVGKEPMIRVLGRTATEAVKKALESIESLSRL